MTDVLHDLKNMGRAIAPLAQQIRELCGDDDLAFVDTLEGETDALKAASAAVRTVHVMDAMAEATKVVADRYRARAADFSRRSACARAALAQFMGEIGETKLILPEGTVSLANGVPSVIGEPDVDALPDAMVRTKREPDRSAIKEALLAGVVIPGCSLSNAPPRLQIRVR